MRTSADRPVTLAEFLHPIRQSPKREQVLAALYFLKHHRASPDATPGEIKDALVKAQIPRSRKANVSDVLAKLIPLVERGASSHWKITGSGEAHVRQQLVLAEDVPQVEEDVSSLSRLSNSVPDEKVRDYVDEAIKCLQVGARRAAVVFLWAGVVHEIRERIWIAAKAKEVEDLLLARNPKARFRKKDDFSLVKDSALIEITGDLSLFDKSERKRLVEALDLRNDCGHPVKYKPGEKKVSSFIEDVLQVVFGAKP
jgi:hypothetical protein